mmetsp:Transcript_2341/g.5762  ORF Transcript_2341/g.5762 Transcript_2341/m.5762 type:complete len:277 (-) Transcript_2341:1049-1879(-)
MRQGPQLRFQDRIRHHGEGTRQARRRGVQFHHGRARRGGQLGTGVSSHPKIDGRGGGRESTEAAGVGNRLPRSVPRPTDGTHHTQLPGLVGSIGCRGTSRRVRIQVLSGARLQPRMRQWHEDEGTDEGPPRRGHTHELPPIHVATRTRRRVDRRRKIEPEHGRRYCRIGEFGRDYVPYPVARFWFLPRRSSSGKHDEDQRWKTCHLGLWLDDRGYRQSKVWNDRGHCPPAQSRLHRNWPGLYQFGFHSRGHGYNANRSGINERFRCGAGRRRSEEY